MWREHETRNTTLLVTSVPGILAVRVKVANTWEQYWWSWVLPDRTLLGNHGVDLGGSVWRYFYCAVR